MPYNPDPCSGNWLNYNYHNTIYHPSAPSLSSSLLYSNLNIYSPVSNSRMMHPGEAISRGYKLYDYDNQLTSDPFFFHAQHHASTVLAMAGSTIHGFLLQYATECYAGYATIISCTNVGASLIQNVTQDWSDTNRRSRCKLKKLLEHITDKNQ